MSKIVFGRKVRRQKKRFSDWISTHLELTRPITSEKELKEEAENFDIFVCGSDQIWRLPERGFYFLDFTPEHVRRVAYAPSFGNIGFDEPSKALIRSYLRRFDAPRFVKMTAQPLSRACSTEKFLQCLTRPSSGLPRIGGNMPPNRVGEYQNASFLSFRFRIRSPAFEPRKKSVSDLDSLRLSSIRRVGWSGIRSLKIISMPVQPSFCV